MINAAQLRQRSSITQLNDQPLTPRRNIAVLVTAYFIGAAFDRPPRTETTATDSGEVLSLAGEEDIYEDEEPIAPSGCSCRHYKGELTVVGRLKGTPTVDVPLRANGPADCLAPAAGRGTFSIIEH